MSAGRHTRRKLLAIAFAAGALAGQAAPADARSTAAPIEAVRGAGQPETAAAVAELARQLATHFNVTGELQLELLRAWTPPRGTWRLEVLEYPAVLAGSMLLRSRILADGNPPTDVTFVVRAMLWRDAWAARQPLATGAPFEPTTLDVRRIDVLRERDVVTVDDAGGDYVLARNIAAGRLLTWRDLARRPLVRKGELVEVEAAEGRLLITMKAVAMENGARGDTIALRNPESRKNFSALVINENRVRVRF